MEATLSYSAFGTNAFSVSPNRCVHKEFALEELSEEELQLLVVIFNVFKILLNFVKPYRGVLLPQFTVPELPLQIVELVLQYLHLQSLIFLKTSRDYMSW